MTGDPAWFKSSHSTTNGCVEVHTHWRKATASNANGCVEVGTVVRSSHCAADSCVTVEGLGDGVAVRDSKDRGGPALTFTRAEWVAFLAGVRGGEFDLSNDNEPPTRR